MLSNLETEKSKLIQIALVGQPELRAVMSRPELEQLRQRVTVSYHLPALDMDETAAYINHRLARAAHGSPLVFDRDVTSLVHLHSRGLPRRINVVADAILLYGYGEGQKTIDLELAQKAIDELLASGILASNTLASDAQAAVKAEVPAATTGGVAPTAVPTAEIVAASQVSAELVARQERVLTALQRLMAEQNHLLQAHREQLAALVKQAEDRRAAPAAAPSAPPPTVQRTSAARLPVDPPHAAAPRAERPAASTAPDWPNASQRLLVPQAATAGRETFWSRLGRGFVSTFSPAYKD